MGLTGIKGNKKPLPAVTGSGHVQSEMNLMNYQILADIEPIVKHPSLARDASQLEIFKTKFKPLQGTVFTHFFKEKLWNASDKKCAYCGIELYCFTDVRVDHFQPKSKILIEHVDNYVCSCASCNSMKCNVDIEEFRFRFAVYNSSIRGIILPSQAKQLVDVGVDLPIQLGEFYFEKVCEAKNEVNS